MYDEVVKNTFLGVSKIQQIFTKCSYVFGILLMFNIFASWWKKKGQGSFLCMEWTLKDLEESYEESWKKQP